MKREKRGSQVPGRFAPGVFVDLDILGYRRLALDRSLNSAGEVGRDVLARVGSKHEDNASLYHNEGLVSQTAQFHTFLVPNNLMILRKRTQIYSSSSHRLLYFLECAYVSSSLDLTYSPAVTTGYFGGNSSEKHDGIA
jgi:hypothetical protein